MSEKTVDTLAKGNGKSKSRITRRTLSLDELATLMGYTRGEKIVAIDYRTEAGGLIVIAEGPVLANTEYSNGDLVLAREES